MVSFVEGSNLPLLQHDHELLVPHFVQETLLVPPQHVLLLQEATQHLLHLRKGGRQKSQLFSGGGAPPGPKTIRQNYAFDLIDAILQGCGAPAQHHVLAFCCQHGQVYDEAIHIYKLYVNMYVHAPQL